MKKEIKELLGEAKSDQLRGGAASVPDLRPEVLEGILKSGRLEKPFPGGMVLLRMSSAGAAVAFSVAVVMTLAEEKKRQEEAAMVWEKAWETEEQK